MGWQLRVYDPANDTLQGTLSEAYGVSASFRLGTLGALSFTIDLESTADLALLPDNSRRVIRIYDDVLEQELPEAFLHSDAPAASSGDTEPEPDAPSSVTFQCPTLGAWLGTSQKGGAVLYPRKGLTGRKRDPRPFGWQSFDHDKSDWITATDLGSQASPDVSSMSGFPAGWLDGDARWIWSEPLDDGVHDAVTSYFWTSLNYEGLVRVSFTANTSGVLWIDEDKALETDPDDRFAFKEFRYVDFDLDGETGFGIKATNRGGPAGVILSVVALDDEGEPSGDPLLQTDDTWLTLHAPASVPGVTPGFLMDVVLSEAQTRGAIPHLSWTFDGSETSDEEAWSKEIAHQFRIGSKLGWVDEQVTQWAADSWVDELGEYHLDNLRGSDLTGTASLHTLEDVRFQGEAPVANALLYLSSDDMAEMDVVSALDRIEEAVTFGTSDEVEALTEMAELLLDELSTGHDTATLALSDAGAQPVEDFWIGDVVSHPGRDGSTTGRVTELVGTLDDGGVDWQVTCEFEDGGFSRTRARRLQEQLRETFDQTAGGRARLSHPKAGPSVGAPGGGKKGGGDGGFPATITVETFGQEIPSGEWTALDWVAATRNNLMSFAGTEIRRPVSGTWHAHDVAVEWQGVDFDSDWKGGGAQARLVADGEPVWPQGLEQNTSPDRGLPVPVWAKESLPTNALPAGLTTLEVRQQSGEPQTVERAFMSLSIREPRAAEQAPLVLGPPFELGGWVALAHGGATVIREPGDVTTLSLTNTRGVAWSPDGRLVAFKHQAEGGGGAYTVFNVQTGEVESGWPELPGDDQETQNDGDVVFSPDGARLYVGRLGAQDNRPIVEIDVATKTLGPVWWDTSSQHNASWKLAIHPGGGLLASLTQKLVVSSAELRSVLWERPGPEASASLAFSPDGAMLARIRRGTAFTSQNLLVYDVASETQYPLGDWPAVSGGVTATGAVAWSPDGTMLAAAHASSLAIIDVATRSLISEPSSVVDVGPIRTMAWNYQGTHLLVGGDTGYDVLDMADPASPTTTSGWPTVTGAVSNAVFYGDPSGWRSG